MAGGKSKSRRSRRGGRQRHIKVNENPIEFSSNGGHANHVLEQLNLQRLHGGLCDVALVVGGRKFDAHRNVLAACSQYFKSMFENGRFRESKQKEVKIQSLDAEAIEILLEYMYTDSITITFSNVEGIIAASDLFLIQAVRDYCANYWTQTLCVDNVLSAYKNADIYNLSQLRDEAEAFLSKHFTEIVESNEFVNYPYEVVVVMIKSDLIDVDEKDVFLAVKKWVMHAKERVSLLDDLMSRIRLPLMPAADLIECVNVEPLVLKSEWCQALVQEAMNYQLLPNKQGELQTPRSRPRYVNLDEMIFAVGVTGTEGHIPDMLLTKCYIPRHNAWYSLATLHAVSLRGLTFCNGLLYALCFNTENEQLDLYMYDIVSNAWSDGPSINKSNHVIRRSIQLSNTWVQLIECRQKVYVMISVVCNHNQGVVSSVLCYDPSPKTWKSLPCFHTERLYYSAAATDIGIYLIGGKIPLGEGMSDVEFFDPDTETWSVKSEMHLPRHSMNICFWSPERGILVSDYECRDPDVYYTQQDRWTSFSDEAELCDSLPVFFTDCPGGNEMLSTYSPAMDTIYATCEASFDDTLATWYKFSFYEKRWEACASLPQLLMPYLCAVR